MDKRAKGKKDKIILKIVYEVLCCNLRDVYILVYLFMSVLG